MVLKRSPRSFLTRLDLIFRNDSIPLSNLSCIFPYSNTGSRDQADAIVMTSVL